MVAYLIINSGEFGFWKEGGGCCNSVTAEDCHRPAVEASVTLTGGLLPMGWELRRDSWEFGETAVREEGAAIGVARLEQVWGPTAVEGVVIVAHIRACRTSWRRGVVEAQRP